MDQIITEVESTLVAALEHLGAPALVNHTARRFIEWRKATGLSRVASSRTYGIVYNNPDTTPADEFRFDICGW